MQQIRNEQGVLQMEKELQLIEAAEEVLAGFKSIVGMTAQAQLEEVKPYDLIAAMLIRIGVDLDDRRIASHLSPSAQLLEKLTQKASTLILPPEQGRTPRARIFVTSLPPIELPLPSALADMEKAATCRISSPRSSPSRVVSSSIRTGTRPSR
jgi:hypothetical protein